MPTSLLLASEGAGITVNGPLVVASFDLFGITWNLTESIIVQWFVILILLAVVLILTHNMKVIPETRRQAAAEMIVEFFRGTVDTSMGTRYKAYQPYMAALFCFSMISSLMSLLGLRSPTADISVTGAWALITFVMLFQELRRACAVHAAV